MSVMKRLGENLKSYVDNLVYAGDSMEDIAAKIGISRKMLVEYCKGKGNIESNTVDKIIGNTELSVEDLYGISDLHELKEQYERLIGSLMESFEHGLNSVLAGVKRGAKGSVESRQVSRVYGGVMEDFITEIMKSDDLDRIKELLKGSDAEAEGSYHVPPCMSFPLKISDGKVVHRHSGKELDQLERIQEDITYDFRQKITLAKKAICDLATGSGMYAQIFTQPDEKAILTAGESSVIKHILKAAQVGDHVPRIVIGISAGTNQPPIEFEGVRTWLEARDLGYEAYLLRSTPESFREDLAKFLEDHKRKELVALFGFEAITTRRGSRKGELLAEELVSNVEFLNILRNLRQIRGARASVYFAGECYKIMDPGSEIPMFARLNRDFITGISCSEWVDYLVTDHTIHKKDEITGDFEISCCKRRRLSKFGW